MSLGYGYSLYLKNSRCFQSLDPFLKLRNVQICQSLTVLNLSGPLAFSDSRIWGCRCGSGPGIPPESGPGWLECGPPRPGKSSFSLVGVLPRTGSPGGGPLWPPSGCPPQQGQIRGFYTTKQQKQPTPVHIFTSYLRLSHFLF